MRVAHVSRLYFGGKSIHSNGPDFSLSKASLTTVAPLAEQIGLPWFGGRKDVSNQERGLLIDAPCFYLVANTASRSL